jgi:hypothetical protein
MMFNGMKIRRETDRITLLFVQSKKSPHKAGIILGAHECAGEQV